MPRFEQILPMIGPMIDTLDQERLQSNEGIVRKRTNMTPDQIGNVFANLGIKGTLEFNMPSNFELPDGTNKTIGWCVDFDNESIIWCMWNSNGNHCVYSVKIPEHIVQCIFYSEPDLNFQENSIINCTAINGRFYWNDNTTEPKSFNIQKAIDYTNNNAVQIKYINGDKPFSEKVFPLIKIPPRYAPSATFSSDSVDEKGQTINFNNLRKKQWQFKYCWVYEDYQESPYSPISTTPVSVGDVDAIGVWISPITENNTLNVKVNTGNNNVKKIKIAVRDASLRNSGPFYLFKEVEKFDSKGVQKVSNDTEIEYPFRNNVNLLSIDTERENTYFHNVPLRAKDLILLDNKYLAMSNPVEGYNYKEADVDYSLSQEKMPVAFDSYYTKMSVSYNVVTEYPAPNIVRKFHVYTITLPANFYPSSEYKIQFQYYSGDVQSAYTTGISSSGYPTTVRDTMFDQLDTGNYYEVQDEWVDEAVEITKIGGNQIRFKMLEQNQTFTGYVKGLVFIPQGNPVYVGLKRGQYHPFAIVYNDKEGRYNVAFGDEKLYVTPFDPKYGTVYFREVIKPKITIRHRPPQWAYTYRIAYIPNNSYTYFLQVPQVEQVKGDGSNGIPTNKYFLKINQAIIRIKEGYPNSLIEAYVWQNGDRVKHIGYEDSYELLEEFSRIYSEGFENIVETGYLCDFEFPTGVNNNKVAGLEIYRPNRTPQDKAYVEIGEEFPILNPGTATRTHSGRSQNQSSDLTNPAISILDFGDIYFRNRLSNDIDLPNIRVESSDVSDYFESSGISIGRAVVRTDLKQSVLGRVNRSENYIENTELNRLNIFLPGTEFYDVSELDGNITRILQKGDVLKIIQEHKETSVYIGKNYAKDGNGNDIILVSDRTFGSFNKYDPYVGSKYPNAIVASEDYVYYLDTFTGDLMRSASNGTMSLPKQYGMQLYFDEKCRAFRDYQGYKDIMLSIEPNQDKIYATFIMGNMVETIAFSENQMNKGFVHFIEFFNGNMHPDKFAWFGDNMFSWSNGRLFIHGLGEINSFYGSDRKEATIEMVANMNPEISKTFETIEIDSDGEWTAEALIRETNNYPFGQYTTILAPMFKSREGKLVSAIPRNIRDQKGADDINRLYSGNKMNGAALNIKMRSMDFTALREVKLKLINQK